MAGADGGSAPRLRWLRPKPPAGTAGTPAGGEPAARTRAGRAAPGEAEPAEAACRGGSHAEPVPRKKPAEAEQGKRAGTRARRRRAGRADPDAGRKSRDVGPLAVVGIIVGVIALVGVAAGVLAVVTHGFRPKTVITYRPAAVFGLRPGQCVNSGANRLNVHRVVLRDPHDAEVFATLSLPAGPGPAPRRCGRRRATAAPAGSTAT